MRIFEKSRRIKINKDTEISIFSEELDYYRTNNRYPVVLFGKNITNIYKNINVQVVVSKRCNFKCGFCIENDGTNGKAKEICPSVLFEDVICQYTSHGIFPNVSITGGEPTLFTDRLEKIFSVCHKYGLKKVNINTNGEGLDKIEHIDGFNVNLSRHHYDDQKSKDIFGKPFKKKIIPNRTSAQCVLMKGYIETVDDMKKYMDHYSSEGITGFSFRGLTELDSSKDYSNEVKFSKTHSIDFYKIVEEISIDPDFEFVQQKVGDHYWFEIWKYKGMFFRLTYSNFEWLRKVETEERNRGEIFSRATIVLPNGRVYSGWTYDINELYNVDKV